MSKSCYNTYIRSNKQELEMARETRAQREARLELELQGRLAMARATYTERMMAVLERAVRENFELTVKGNQFLVADRDERRVSPYAVQPVWSETADMDLYSLEVSVELKEEASAELVRKAQVRGNALAKLTEEERELLGLE
jgi:hypothetical protein